MMKHILLLIVLLSFSNIQSQTSDRISETLLIGVTESPPFVIVEDGEYSGISIASWNLIKDSLDLNYQFVKYETLAELLQAVETSKVDLSVNPITVTSSRLRKMDFSQPYFIAHTAMVQKSESLVWKYISNIISWRFISAILLLLGVIFIFGVLVWFFERRKNPEQFPSGIKGIFQGFWWSAVTMTTVGYGDKSPTSLGGRIIGLIWMFSAIIMISSLTAGIASSLTVQNMNSKIDAIEDLNNHEVLTVQSSSAEELLRQYGIKLDAVNSAKDGFQALKHAPGSVLVYDQPILKYYIEQNDLGDDYRILPKMLKKDYYSYSFPKGSDLLEIIDPILVSSLKTQEWNRITEDYK